MKILVFTTLYPNNTRLYHGVFVKERMSRVARLEGCDLRVIAPVPYFPSIPITRRWRFSQVMRYEQQEGIEVYHPRYLITPKIGMALYGFSMFLSVLPTIARVQRKFSFDILDTHYVYPDGFAGVLLGRYFKRPVVVSARGSDINLLSQLPLMRNLLRYTLKKSDRIVAVSQALKNEMVRLGIRDDKIHLIPNGIDTEKFYPIVKSHARTQVQISSDQKIILSVAALIPNKGVDILIRALQILLAQKEEKNCCLVIIGAGPLRAELEKLATTLGVEKHVRLVGAVPHGELYRWYNAADVFCLASSREGWPNVVTEALACGTPVVATDVGGIPEIICSPEIGLVTKRHEREFADALALALKKPWQRDSIVMHARERTWEQVARSLHDVFTSVVNTRSKPLPLSTTTSTAGRC